MSQKNKQIRLKNYIFEPHFYVNKIEKIATLVLSVASYLFAYIFLYGYYFESEMLTLETFVSPVPFELRSLLFLGSLIFSAFLMIVLINYKTANLLIDGDEAEVIANQLVAFAFIALFTMVISKIASGNLFDIKLFGICLSFQIVILSFSFMRKNIVRSITTLIESLIISAFIVIAIQFFMLHYEQELSANIATFMILVLSYLIYVSRIIAGEVELLAKVLLFTVVAIVTFAFISMNSIIIEKSKFYIFVIILATWCLGWSLFLFPYYQSIKNNFTAMYRKSLILDRSVRNQSIGKLWRTCSKIYGSIKKHYSAHILVVLVSIYFVVLMSLFYSFGLKANDYSIYTENMQRIEIGDSKPLQGYLISTNGNSFFISIEGKLVVISNMSVKITN